MYVTSKLKTKPLTYDTCEKISSCPFVGIGSQCPYGGPAAGFRPFSPAANSQYPGSTPGPGTGYQA